MLILHLAQLRAQDLGLGGDGGGGRELFAEAGSVRGGVRQLRDERGFFGGEFVAGGFELVVLVLEQAVAAQGGGEFGFGLGELAGIGGRLGCDGSRAGSELRQLLLQRGALAIEFAGLLRGGGQTGGGFRQAGFELIIVLLQGGKAGERGGEFSFDIGEFGVIRRWVDLPEVDEVAPTAASPPPGLPQ